MSMPEYNNLCFLCCVIVIHLLFFSIFFLSILIRLDWVNSIAAVTFSVADGAVVNENAATVKLTKNTLPGSKIVFTTNGEGTFSFFLFDLELLSSHLSRSTPQWRRSQHCCHDD
jgi:hypothetical protein